MRARVAGHLTGVLLGLLSVLSSPALGFPQTLREHTTAMPPDRCTGKYDIGPCKTFLHKWHYNSTTRLCHTFIYGGCEGNNNRFDSEAECLFFCVGGDHTLPPYLNTTPSTPTTEATTPELTSPTTRRTVTFVPTVPTPPPVPIEKRGAELTFEETGHQKVFMFAQSNTFIQLDAYRIPTFQLRLCREISFQFRTRLPHGLLVYHSVKDRPEHLEPYALYVIVENGQLKVVHVFGKHSTSLTVGRGLNRDDWHTVDVRIDVHGDRLIAKVDDQEKETKLLGLHADTNYGVPTDLPSIVLVGGLSPEEKLHGVKYIIESFVGCIKHMTLSSGKAASDLLPILPLVATKHENVVEGCMNKCHSRRNLCFEGSRCVNHYNKYTCDCFGTDNEGEYCDHNTATMITLRGASYLSYRVYDWKDRVESSENRISMSFKTRYDDSVLLYASGEPYEHHYIAVAIKDKTVHIEIDFGDGAIKTTIGEDVTSDMWMNLTIAHHSAVIEVRLNHLVKMLDLPGQRVHLYIDPEIYIGGGPDLDKKRELASNNSYAGVLKYVFFNDVSILYELQRANPKVHYIGVLDPEMEDADVDDLPLTFAFPSTHIWWPHPHKTSLTLKFGFHSTRTDAALAAGNLTLDSGSKGSWELRTEGDEVKFEVTGDREKNETYVTAVKYDYIGSWHLVELGYDESTVKLMVNYRQVTTTNLTFQLESRVIVGSGQGSNPGLVGCMRDIQVNEEAVEPRSLVKTERAVGEITMDNCMLVDPCKRPNTCEHGGKCSVADEKVICDCKGTGYIGNNCHFAEFRKTCEELALLGYTKPDVYLIDIDGNGRFPPAHVKCEFQSKDLEESTKTIVEHNLPSQVDVRGEIEEDFQFNITYREFTAEMLQELISHSLRCSQYIKYDCYKAPLELHSATWFISSAGRSIVDFVGNVKRGICPCAVNRSCLNSSQACNCDVSEGKWHSDEGFYVTPESLGITEMVFLQQKELNNDALGRITLGPLECVETNTQQYVVTFTSSQSYIEVPGWRKGDISFSFRTTGEKAILLYQPPIRPRHPSFMVALTSDYHLTFNFTLSNGISREMIIMSQRRLNGGEWQKIWIDYNDHHVRFMINTDYQMVDLLPSEEFGPFEGSMFIGGATEGMLKKSSVQQGLIGCFRGLVVNGEILDIYSYMSVHLSEIIKDCKPSCDPNPCKNNAMCKELWSTFQCVCQNPWAHVGTYCETNINTNGVMFLRPESYIKRNYLANVSDEEKLFLTHLMNENILINLRTYDTDSLVLYANDHLNNFVQLHLAGGRWVVFMFNVGPEIHNVSVEYPGLNSGKSIQVAIDRSDTETVLHVNERKASISTPILMLKEYSNKPWTNPEREVLAPQRPPAPPTEYFQINLGGFDSSNLIATSESHELCGYVGCIRGLQIGDHLVDLPAQVPYSVNKDADGVKAGCQMKCDEMPCKNEGICIEDFLKGEITCDCDKTSYYGEFCATEKGADFGGDSALQRKYVLEGPVNQVKVQLAFSSSDQRQQRTVLLLLQTENKRSYSLMVALTSEGYLIFKEDLEGAGMVAIIKDRHFLNGARHSIYYQRTNSTSLLLIDREKVVLESNPLARMNEATSGEGGTNEVQVGGIITKDPRFAGYTSYSGCLSNVFLEVNSYVMKPLEEYMLFTKTGSEKVNVMNAAGVRSAQCSFFDVINKPQPGPMLNLSLDLHKVWMEEPPAKIPYVFTYAYPSTEENGSTHIIFLVLTTIFVLIVLLGLCLVYRSHLQYKKRLEEETDAAILWQKGQPVKYQDPIITPSVAQMTAYKPVPQQEPKVNGTDSAPIVKNNYQPVSTTPPAEEVPVFTETSPTEEDKVEPQKGKDTDLLIPQQRSLHNSIAEEDENIEDDEDDEDAEEEKLLDIPSKSAYDEVANGASTLGEDNNSSALLSPPTGDESKARDSLKAEAAKTRAFMPATLSPVFLSEDQRTFANPISYLGGPRIAYPNTSRASKESILSVD